MTPNHGYTPADDRRREQATPGQQPTGQPGQQPQPRQGQPLQPQQPPQQVQGAQGQQVTGQQAPAPQGPGGAPQQPRQGQQAQRVQQTQQPQQRPQLSQQPPGAIPGQQLPGQGSQQAAVGAEQRPTGVQPQQRPQHPSAQQPLLKPIRVNEIITEDVVTADKDTPVRTVVAQMSEHNVGSVVVIEDDRPIGIITDRKVALALEEMPDIAQRTAEELLHGDVFTADPSMSIFDAIEVMSDEGVRRLPIVDDNGALRGIVTLDDALVLLGGVVSEVADTVQSQSPRL
ncbi:CBS domain-containing protein [Haloarcula onubensis]|uniref:CBS domain-containing protein n=1 Tax=Haloarcula onubensis TaxID=2950539 RepID=A0ABU2FWS6_9EURY|nr:CBS domain-containing protein [Halomicroarcula sp. S3CR25-11]MDS0284601.1 CBS domain-containing protein [Halomicroarcula sp. S3CR25-11]